MRVVKGMVSERVGAGEGIAKNLIRFILLVPHPERPRGVLEASTAELQESLRAHRAGGRPHIAPDHDVVHQQLVFYLRPATQQHAVSV